MSCYRLRNTKTIAFTAYLPDNHGARDKEGASLMQREEPVEVQVATVHDVNGRRLRNQKIECVDIVQFSIGNVDKTGDRTPQVEQCVQLDRRLGRAKRRPWKERQTQVDRRGVERIGPCSTDPVPSLPSRKACALARSAVGRTRRRCASPGARWHRPRSRVSPASGYPCDRAWRLTQLGRHRCPAGFRGSSTVQTPGRESARYRAAYGHGDRRHSA
jgi:hypothetical protein